MDLITLDKQNGFQAGIACAIGTLYAVADNDEDVEEYVKAIQRASVAFLEEHS